MFFSTWKNKSENLFEYFNLRGGGVYFSMSTTNSLYFYDRKFVKYNFIYIFLIVFDYIHNITYTSLSIFITLI